MSFTLRLLTALTLVARFLAHDQRAFVEVPRDTSAQPLPATCSVARPDSGPLYETQQMVRSADAIVVAVAARTASRVELSSAAGIMDSGPTGSESAIAFRTLAVLKGRSVPDTLFIVGEFVDHDEFNTSGFPYTFARPSAGRGWCWTEEYRQGAMYLLMLHRQQTGRLSPYWWPLEPVNEQLHLPADHWLTWVRQQIETQSRQGKSQ